MKSTQQGALPIWVKYKCFWFSLLVEVVSSAWVQSLLYARVNVLIRKFSRCNRDVKLCLLVLIACRPMVLNCETVFHSTVLRRFSAAYVHLWSVSKCSLDFGRRDCYVLWARSAYIYHHCAQCQVITKGTFERTFELACKVQWRR